MREIEKPAFMRSLQYDLVHRATRFEGPSAQLFGLAQALIKGPVPEDSNPKPEQIHDEL